LRTVGFDVHMARGVVLHGEVWARSDGLVVDAVGSVTRQTAGTGGEEKQQDGVSGLANPFVLLEIVVAGPGPLNF